MRKREKRSTLFSFVSARRRGENKNKKKIAI